VKLNASISLLSRWGNLKVSYASPLLVKELRSLTTLKKQKQKAGLAGREVVIFSPILLKIKINFHNQTHQLL